jgi:hypothetical protein
VSEVGGPQEIIDVVTHQGPQLQSLANPRSLPSAGLTGTAPAGPTQHHASLHSLHQAQQPEPATDLYPGGGN